MLRSSNLQVTVSYHISRCLPQELQARPTDQGIHEGLRFLCVFPVCRSQWQQHQYASSTNSAVTSLRPRKLDFGMTEVQPEQQSQSANNIHIDRLLLRPCLRWPHALRHKCILPVLFLPGVALTRLMLHAVEADDEHDESHSPQC
ncbi:hypothetical protein B0H11DRAFT_2184469 [Mycena galericulata]|nr:hypothetical protein B0H11DRAFT_2193422 [Mycena galericulata]KAJ7509356.1 hypothetical protein B0H11DRAFT_2184469 [Mycena galericulata]